MRPRRETSMPALCAIEANSTSALLMTDTNPEGVFLCPPASCGYNALLVSPEYHWVWR